MKLSEQDLDPVDALQKLCRRYDPTFDASLDRIAARALELVIPHVAEGDHDIKCRLCALTSVDTSKPATSGRGKTGHQRWRPRLGEVYRAAAS